MKSLLDNGKATSLRYGRAIANRIPSTIYDTTFSSIEEAFKAEGDRQAKENGIVELFSCMAACAKDPFRGISIIYRPSKWIDKDGSEFAFILVKGNSSKE